MNSDNTQAQSITDVIINWYLKYTVYSEWQFSCSKNSKTTMRL